MYLVTVAYLGILEFLDTAVSVVILVLVYQDIVEFPATLALADTAAIPAEVVIPALVYQDIPDIPEAMEQMALLGLVASLVFQVTQAPMELTAHLDLAVFQDIQGGLEFLVIQVAMDLQVLLDLADIPASVDILVLGCQDFLALLGQALQSMQLQA